MTEAEVQPVPEGYRTVTPMLVAENAANLIAFLKEGLGAVLRHRHDRPDGKIMHAEVLIGDSPVMVADACPPMGAMPTTLYLYVEDADVLHRRAVNAGAESLMEPADQFWGDRMGGVIDPWKNVWWIATHLEDVSEQELARRAQAQAKQMQSAK